MFAAHTTSRAAQEAAKTKAVHECLCYSLLIILTFFFAALTAARAAQEAAEKAQQWLKKGMERVRRNLTKVRSCRIFLALPFPWYKQEGTK